MKKHLLLFTILLSLVTLDCWSQSFSAEDYIDFQKQVEGINEDQLATFYPRSSEIYLKGFDNAINFEQVSYLDSVIQKLNLTESELRLLRQNMFFVTERLSFNNFGRAFHEVYQNDLPVFVSTDAILHALHMSYDQILKNLERNIMSGNLEEFLKSLYDNFMEIQQKYANNKTLSVGVYDADIFVTIAYSLITDKLQAGHYVDNEKLREIWEAIQNEQLVSMPLFTYPERSRKLDFSQFKVRGHYVFTEQDKWMGLKSLEPYFKTMMWLGRMDFLLTPPPENPWEEPWTDYEIQRMHYGAYMVNELVQKSEKLPLLKFNEKVINYLVGESDNITPSEYTRVLEATGIDSPEDLTDMDNFHKLQEVLNSHPQLAQKILSDFFLMDPTADKPGVLPISYRLSGQRFIIDSYLLGNVVFDKLIHDGQKVMRMMPNPMDILFPLGNNDVLPILKPEFEKYPYAEQLARLRYLVDSKPESFWSGSLYNVWLSAIRGLNPLQNDTRVPLFMQSAAWQHEKMNTQLAGWSQLRHDNLLYAKQSYTGGTGCSFPLSYVEPYPEFYRRIKQFVHDAAAFFSQLPTSHVELTNVARFFPDFENVMEKLEVLAEKQLNKTAFSNQEIQWLQTMLFSEGGSGVPPYSGWYTDLFYDKWDAAEGDFTIVDVHTQPTDEFGSIVGKVLHTGVGKVNMGVFLAKCPLTNNQLTAFVGPVMSYYEKITDNFYRMTDQEWEDLVHTEQVPARPRWTHIYLAGKKGEELEPAIELPSKVYTASAVIPADEMNIIAYPNPVNDNLTLSVSVENAITGDIEIFNSTGTLIIQTGEKYFNYGQNTIQLSFGGLPEGLYLVKTSLRNGESSVLKVIKR